MRSHLISADEPVPKPWKEEKNPRATFSYYLTYFMVFLGLAGGLVQSYFKYSNAQLDRQPLCLVFEEDFNSEDEVFGTNGTFQREVNMDGNGNGEFEMTTGSTNNSYIQDGMLYIVPTLTAEQIGWDAVFNNTVFNITGCTFNETAPNNGYITNPNGQTVFNQAGYLAACSAVSNSTADTVINPVQSARITTRQTASIKYGRVEIRAKMPAGDWLWPAMWMLPRDSVYGVWPRSGEIDIVESRGNGIRYTARGSNYVQGSLNWGPTEALNSVSKTYSWWSDRRQSFASEFHTYALEWTDKFLRVYVDSRLHTLLDISFKKPFFQLGDYPTVIVNGSTLEPLQNPWINGTNATPFDQEFYLILNVAVGGTNGWFPDWQGNKPWINAGVSPMSDFAKAYTQWYPTWPTDPSQRGLVVDYVKMWKHCDGK
jgi:beta-glucanase (GH16 family)